MLAQIEYLYTPGSWVERNGPEQILVHMKCVVRMLSVRVNKNGKALTVEASSHAAPVYTGARCRLCEILSGLGDL
jgi:hypothetical protein